MVINSHKNLVRIFTYDRFYRIVQESGKPNAVKSDQDLIDQRIIQGHYDKLYLWMANKNRSVDSKSEID